MLVIPAKAGTHFDLVLMIENQQQEQHGFQLALE